MDFVSDFTHVLCVMHIQCHLEYVLRVSQQVYHLKYEFAPQGLNLVFVAMYQHVLSLPYVDELLELIKEEFSKQYAPPQLEYEFDDTYKRLLDRCQKRAMEAKMRSQTKAAGNSIGRVRLRLFIAF